jgi:hypothetical protein
VKGRPGVKDGEVGKKRALYKQIVNEGSGGVDLACLWMDANEEELKELRNGLITIADTAYGCFKAKQRMDVIWECRTMSAGQREEIRRILPRWTVNKAVGDKNEHTNVTPVYLTKYHSIIIVIHRSNHIHTVV